MPADKRVPVYQDTLDLMKEEKRRGESYDEFIRRLMGVHDD